MNNIIIVCDEKEISENLKSNLMLLRKFDTILCTKFLNAQEIISQNNPNTILIYSNTIEENILNLIKEFRKIPILFVSYSYTDETLLNLYEAGISDYIKTDSSQSEYLIKIMLCIRKNLNTKKLERYSDILRTIGIIDSKNCFYSKKYTPAVLKNLSEKYIEENTKLSLIAIAPDIEEKNKCNFEYLANIVKENLRDDDIIGFGTDKLYVLLPNTTYQGALGVYNKIKKFVEYSYKISAGVIEITSQTNYKTLMQKVDEALEDALTMKNCAVIQDDLTTEPPMTWLDKKNKKHKNFKLFKKVFLKKLETVIAPVFYQKQQIAEQRLFETKVEQFCGEKKNIFSLKNEKQHSFIEITYPGAVKINVSTYKNEFCEPETQSFELSQINENLIGEIIDKLIRDFQKEN